MIATDILAEASRTAEILSQLFAVAARQTDLEDPKAALARIHEAAISLGMLTGTLYTAISGILLFERVNRDLQAINGDLKEQLAVLEAKRKIDLKTIERLTRECIAGSRGGAKSAEKRASP